MILCSRLRLAGNLESRDAAYTSRRTMHLACILHHGPRYSLPFERDFSIGLTSFLPVTSLSPFPRLWTFQHLPRCATSHLSTIIDVRTIIRFGERFASQLNAIVRMFSPRVSSVRARNTKTDHEQSQVCRDTWSP